MAMVSEWFAVSLSPGHSAACFIFHQFAEFPIVFPLTLCSRGTFPAAAGGSTGFTLSERWGKVRSAGPFPVEQQSSLRRGLPGLLMQPAKLFLYSLPDFRICSSPQRQRRASSPVLPSRSPYRACRR